jgi:PPOX class probable F420-dependent enzyme
MSTVTRVPERTTKSLGRLTRLENRFLDWSRSQRAHEVADAPATGTIDDFRGRKYCVLVTYRRDGRPVPSPLWFGTADGKLYAHTAGVKVVRLRRNPTVRVAPSTFRGRPLAPPIEGTARGMDATENEAADRAIQSNYGWTRRLYYKVSGHVDAGVYIEITPGTSSG